MRALLVATALAATALGACSERVLVGYEDESTPAGTMATTTSTGGSSGAMSGVVATSAASNGTTETAAAGGAGPDLPRKGAPIWEVDFETGDTSQWEQSDGWIYVDNDARYRVAADHHNGGTFALESTVVSIGDALPQAMMLRQFDLYEGYYSANFCVRENYDTSYWVIMKILGDGPFQNSARDDRFDIDLSRSSEDGRLHLQLDERGGEALLSPIPVPIDTWFEIEVFYRSTPLDHGRLVVWQDGVQVFDTGERPTSNSSVVGLGVGVAAWRVSPLPASIWIDDVAVAQAQ